MYTEPSNPPGCDNPFPATRNNDGNCRCNRCPRCGGHGNNQVHLWSYCSKRKQNTGKFHYCCPDNCELDA